MRTRTLLVRYELVDADGGTTHIEPGGQPHCPVLSSGPGVLRFIARYIQPGAAGPIAVKTDHFHLSEAAQEIRMGDLSADKEWTAEFDVEGTQTLAFRLFWVVGEDAERNATVIWVPRDQRADL